ncbi:MAG TPA: hypothetical protein VN824_18890 [Puia sp.]|nr:hypothetical protein [Puia sp.]
MARGKLYFIDPAVSYYFSFYDPDGNPVLSAGIKMIYEVFCQVTIRNAGAPEKMLRDVRLVAIAGGKRFAMTVIDQETSEWKLIHVIPGNSSVTMKWHSFPKNFGTVPGRSHLIPIDPPGLKITFEISYTDDMGMVRRESVNTAEGKKKDQESFTRRPEA